MNNRVKQLRTERGLSQQQLGEAMAVSRQTINSIEKERYTPSLPLAIGLARYFGTNVEEIFHVDEQPGCRHEPPDPQPLVHARRLRPPRRTDVRRLRHRRQPRRRRDLSGGGSPRRRRLLLRRAPLGDARRPRRSWSRRALAAHRRPRHRAHRRRPRLRDHRRLARRDRPGPRRLAVRAARRDRRPHLRPRRAVPAPSLLGSRTERHGPGGPSGLQNRQAVVARRLEGSIPSPLRSALQLGFWRLDGLPERGQFRAFGPTCPESGAPSTSIRVTIPWTRYGPLSVGVIVAVSTVPPRVGCAPAR